MVLLAVLVPALMLLDHQAGMGFSLRLFYLIPTALAAWTFGQRAGLVVAIVSALFCGFVDFGVRSPAVRFGIIFWDAISSFTLFAIFTLVVARHRRFVDETLALARLDDETGLLSRREFDRVLESEARRSRRYRRPLAVMLIDCGGMKDTLNAALVAAVGRVLQGEVREGDSIARVGSKRIGVILVECSQIQGTEVLRRLRDQLAERMGLRLRTGGLGLGLVSYGGHSDTTAARLLTLAEAQMGVARAEHGVGMAETCVL